MYAGESGTRCWLSLLLRFKRFLRAFIYAKRPKHRLYRLVRKDWLRGCRTNGCSVESDIADRCSWPMSSLPEGSNSQRPFESTQPSKLCPLTDQIVALSTTFRADKRRRSHVQTASTQPSAMTEAETAVRALVSKQTLVTKGTLDSPTFSVGF